MSQAPAPLTRGEQLDRVESFTGTTSAGKAILLIMDRMSATKGNCYPSLEYLAERACCDIKTARSAVNKLVDNGYISFVQEGRTRIYTIHYPTLVNPPKVVAIHPPKVVGIEPSTNLPIVVSMKPTSFSESLPLCPKTPTTSGSLIGKEPEREPETQNKTSPPPAHSVPGPEGGGRANAPKQPTPTKQVATDDPRPWVVKIMAAYPESAGPKVWGPVELCVRNLSYADPNEFPTFAAAGAYLLGRVEAFAKSPMSRNMQDGKRVSLTRWLREEAYRTPDEFWQRAYAGPGAISQPAQAPPPGAVAPRKIVGPPSAIAPPSDVRPTLKLA